MRQRLKISLSLLISLVLCGGLAVFSFSSLFTYVETTFFQPRIVVEREAQLEELAGRVSRYHRDNIERFQPVVDEPFVPRTFQESNQLSRNDIIQTQMLFGTLLDEYPNIELVRFLGPEGRRIHFSTSESDIESQDQQRRKYIDYERTGDSVEAEALLTPAGQAPRLIIDGQAQLFVYSFPVVDTAGEYRGVVLFYVFGRGLSEYLHRFPSLDVRDVTLVGRQGIVLNMPEGELGPIEDTLVEIWRAEQVPLRVYREAIVLERGGEQGAGARESYSLLSVNTGEYGSLSLLIPYSVLQLQPIMKVVVIAALFLTVFLIAFLVLNLRQDPVLVLSQRIKRLQLDILQEFIEGKERIDWRQWQRKLEENRAELKSRIKKGIGQIPQQKEAELDGMIDRSWDEIISIIEARVGGPQAGAPDIRHIEELLQRALQGAHLTVQAPVSRPPRTAERKSGIVVEEIGVEEVVEPGEVLSSQGAGVEEAEELEEVEELEEAEAVEEAEGIEELEEAEAVEAGELEEAEAVEEAEGIEELEEAEAVEAEELGEAEAVEEAGEIEELEEAEAVEEADGIEELEEAEAVEAGELEEAEAVEEAEGIEELEEAEVVEAEEVELLEAGTAEAEALPVEGQEVLEELESVKEIVALPPLPQEQLEELPPADESQEGAPAAAGQPTASQEGTVEELEVAEDEAAPIESILGAGEELVMESIPGRESAEPLSLAEIEKLQQADERRQLEDLLEAETIRAYSLKEIEDIIMEQRSSVVMENGVYRIKEEVLAGAGEGPRRRGLMALAEAALKESPRPSSGLESGIGALLGDESIVDLETEIGQIRERSAEIEYSPTKSKRIHFFEDGLDYDGYLKGFRGGKTETDRLRSLVELSGKLKAVNAAIFRKENGKYSLALKVGLNDPGFEVYFTPEEPFVELFVKTRKTVIMGETIEKIKALTKKMHPEDLKYIQSAIVLPVVYRGRESFLLMGLPVLRELDIEDIITRLDIY